MAGLSLADRFSFDRARFLRVADVLAVAVAVSLPWSTSATGILLALWLIALIPALAWTDLRRELMTPAGGLPVLLFLLGALGMVWADVSWIDRWHGLDSFFKLLVIPLLLVQFRRSDRGTWVFAGYLLSCIVLLVVSTVVAAIPPLSAALMHVDHVLVKNPATQSGEFATCIFGLIFLASESALHRRWVQMFGFVAVILALLANLFFVATGRTALVVILVLLVLFAVKKLSARGSAILFAGTFAVVLAAWLSSPYLRDRTEAIWTDFRQYQTSDAANSSGERVEFAKKSIEFIRQAPFIGHGTGSITSLFARTTIGQTGAAASPSSNPHNQSFAVAIQLGLLGTFVLWAMWLAHLRLFRGMELAEWIGFVVVVQNFVGSLFNSHVFDFVQGWVYVVGVGVAGGMVLKRKARDAAGGGSARSP